VLCPKKHAYGDYHGLLEKENVETAVIATLAYLHSEIATEYAKANEG